MQLISKEYNKLLLNFYCDVFWAKFRLISSTPINLKHTIWLCTFATVAALWNDRQFLDFDSSMTILEIRALSIERIFDILMVCAFANKHRNPKNNLIKCSGGRTKPRRRRATTCQMKLLHDGTSDWNESIYTWTKCVQSTAFINILRSLRLFPRSENIDISKH